ncbi:MAG TPA: ArdC family protein, partial [Conexibacter sp.]|nr:ArdC family protein [Conexibacter sp.]
MAGKAKTTKRRGRKAPEKGSEKFDLYQYVTDQIIARLDEGVVPWRQPWATSGRLPANLVSRRPYRGINPLLLSLTGYAKPWWVSYKQAGELGGTVRNGEKATRIVFFKPVVRKAKGEDEESDEVRRSFVLR